ncbi:MAG: large conductance mechanosensitive channel protein MscL [Clostridia bacterium]|nr:large conductance mechanosensitive channel protein MscL [Clostridia bacterium]
MASKFIKEFKEFAVKGNVVDMAVGVIIGGAFGKIVTSVVNDLFMPVIGLITGGANVSGMFALLGKVPEGEAVPKSIEEAAERGIATFNYGNFIQTVIDFILVALCIFLVIKAINKMKKKEEPAPEKEARKCPFCCSEIADDATRCPHCTSELPKYEPAK